MEHSIDNLIRDLEALEQKRQELISTVKEIATSKMKEVAEENNPDIVERLSPHCFTVKASSLREMGWSPVTHNWEESVPYLLNFLDKHPVWRWKEILSEKAKKSKGSVVYITNRIYHGGYTDIKYAIDKRFVEKIIEKI